MADLNSLNVSEAAGKMLTGEHADVVREAVRLVLAELMEAEVAGFAGAARYERSAERLAQRSGYRQRQWDARLRLRVELGELSLRDRGGRPRRQPAARRRALRPERDEAGEPRGGGCGAHRQGGGASAEGGRGPAPLPPHSIVEWINDQKDRTARTLAVRFLPLPYWPGGGTPLSKYWPHATPASISEELQ